MPCRWFWYYLLFYLSGKSLQENYKRILDLAFFTALAVSIFVLENLIPRPFPFLKFGLANVIVLFVLIKLGFPSALVVTLSKTILGGLFSGLLLSPTTILSCSGSLAAVTVMYLFLSSRVNFSLIGLSISGAVVHNLTQLVMVRLILIDQNSIFYLTPLLLIMGIITGILTGYITFLLIKKTGLKEAYETTDL
jgi:heptaprenyl diphosphate synthase